MNNQLSPKQRRVLSFLAEGMKSKKEIVDEFKHWYFYNEAHYIGEILTRLKKRNLVTNPKHGFWELNRKPTPLQGSLFDNSDKN